MNNFANDLTNLLKDGGWQALIGLFLYLSYKSSIVGFIALGIYKAISRIVSVVESASLAKRCASELGVEVPLSAEEEHTIILAIRARNL